jgi:hypothetical protein
VSGAESDDELRFDPEAQLSPLTLFRWLCEGRTPRRVDLAADEAGPTLRGAEPWTGETTGWGEDETVVLLDLDGGAAVALARSLQGQGFHGTRALYGGLVLYDFVLDPEVVGPERFLIPRPARPTAPASRRPKR